MNHPRAAGAAGLLLLAVSLAARSAPAPAPPAAAMQRQFEKIYSDEWTWRQAQQLDDDQDDDGDDGTAGQGAADDAMANPDADADPQQSGGQAEGAAHLPRVALAQQLARQAYWRQVLRQLDALSPAALTPEGRIDYAVYRAQIAALLANQDFREYEMPLNADSAFWSNVTIPARRTLRSAAAYRSYIAWLSDLPRYFAEQVNNMRAGLRRGFTPPRVTLEGRDAALASVAQAASAQETVFYLPFQAMPAAIPAAEQASLRAAGAKAIAGQVMPAYGAVLRFMRDQYLPGARVALDAESLPDGKAYYQSKIVEYTTTTLSAEQIHQIGLAEMAKIRAEMQGAMAQTGFQGELPAFLAFLRSDPRFYAKTAEELLMRAAYVAKRFDAKAGDYFGYLPRRRFAIVPVPADQAPFYTAGRGGPGVYLVNTYNLPARALYSLPALTLHESAPGHAFQMPVAAEQTGRPAFRNEYISAYGEGWALYCERLGSEMGIYQTAYETFGMLSYQAWRAARLVVDTGIHAKHWSREQARAYLHDNTALADHEIATEVDRYISWPGQALSYYLGQMAIVEARRKAERALGPRFDLRAFHDTVLQLGPVPLPVLSARIDRFIADGGPSPYPATH